MDKELNIIRNSVRCFYIKDNNVIAVKTKENNTKPGFFDIPGGKIEDNETMEQAVIREYKEETGLDIKDPIYRGIINVVFSMGTYRFNTFIVNEFEGKLEETDEHIPYFLNISELINYDNRFPCTIMLEPSFIEVLLDKTKTFELTVFTLKNEIVDKIIFDVKELTE